MKNQKGITLIALVITIIVLLILAGISIAMLAGNNGVLTKASDSKIVNLLGEKKDAINLTAATALSVYYEAIFVNGTSTGASEYSGEDLAKTIIAKIKSEHEGSAYTDYTVTVSGAGVGATITIQSKAITDLKTEGAIDNNGAITWTDTFKRGE